MQHRSVALVERQMQDQRGAPRHCHLVSHLLRRQSSVEHSDLVNQPVEEIQSRDAVASDATANFACDSTTVLNAGVG